VKPQTGLFFEKARQQLQRADAMLGIGLHDDAGRAAYLAGLHAAQALIFEITDKARRRHAGVQREFARLVKMTRVSIGNCGRFCRGLTISRPSPIMKPAPHR
jgi:uncharacterized protein (UPF0332 family)